MSDNTRLRYVRSKDPDKIVEFINALGFKVEIKGNVLFAKNKFYLWFIPQDPKDLKNRGVDLD